MNTCQAIVNPDGSKTDTPKAKGIRDAIAYVLSLQRESQFPTPKETVAATRERRMMQLENDGLIFFQSMDVPISIKANVKVLIVEFAGVKFKSFAKSGKEYLKYIENSIFKSIFKDFPQTQHIIFCEEKYMFTPDNFKALTRQKRQKEDTLDVYHLKSDEEMISLDLYSRTALTQTSEGKKLASSFLAAHIEYLEIQKNCIVDVDSEYILSRCICKEQYQHCTKSCKQYAIPVRIYFENDGKQKRKIELQNVKQRKGEAELAQADWLLYVIPELDENDAVLSFVTSGDIDTLPIHLLAVSNFWPRLPNRKFKNQVYLLLKKPGKDIKPDIFCVTKIVERLEEQYRNQDIAVIVALALSLGGNDFIPKFYGISHQQWLALLMNNEDYCNNLFTINRNVQTNIIERIFLNEDIYIRMIKKLYCPKTLDETKLTFEEVRQLSIKLPGKEIRNPQLWLPPLSAIKKVACLIKSHTEYLMTVCKPEADLPDFIGNGGLRKTKDDEIIYDFGEEVRYNTEKELLKLPDTSLQERVVQSRARLQRPTSKKRELSQSPYKADIAAKRTLYTSTPR